MLFYTRFLRVIPIKNETQTILLAKLEKYFSIVKNNTPSLYHSVDIAKVTATFTPESCSGLTALWGYYMHRRQKQYFYDSIMAPIFNWNGQKKSLSKTLEITLEYAMSSIGWLQASNLLFEQAVSGRSYIQQSDYDVLINMIKQDDYPNLRKEYEIAFVWQNNELKAFLEDLPTNKLIRLCSSGHALGLFKNDKYLLFDSNGFARPFGNHIFEMQFSLNKTTQLITAIQRSFFYAPRSTLTGLTISLFDSTQNPIPNYLDKTEKIRAVLDARFRIDRTFNINAANNYDNANALYFCAQEGDLAGVQLLLSRKANPTQVTHDSYGPIHIAIQNCHLAVVKELLTSKQSKELINMPLVPGNTPIALAVEGNHSKIVEILLQYGANPEPVNHNGWGPIHFAAQENLSTIIEILLNSKFGEKLLDASLQDDTDRTPLIIAARNGHIELVKCFLRYGSKSTLPKNWPQLMKLFIASKSEQFKATQKAKNEIPKKDSTKDYNHLVKIKAAYLLVEPKVKALHLEIKALLQKTSLSIQHKTAQLNTIKKETENLQAFVYFSTYNLTTKNHTKRDNLIASNEVMFTNLFDKVENTKIILEKKKTQTKIKTEAENSLESAKKRIRR